MAAGRARAIIALPHRPSCYRGVHLAVSQTAEAPAAALVPKRKRIAGAIVTGHAFQHMYADGFLVLLPSIYDAFGLTGFSAGALAAVRQGSAGLLTMGGGFVVDMFSGRRGLLLSGSLFLMGLGYLLVAASPNYTVLLLALTLGSATGSFWHPVGLGLLSTTFPANRAFVMSLHRSAGSLGETLTPLVVGLVLALITWREVLLAGFGIMTVVSIGLYIVLARLGLQTSASDTRGLREQLGELGRLLKTETALRPLLLVSGLRGMADRSFIFFLPLFIAEGLREVDADVGVARIGFVVAYHLVVFSVLGIFVPPLLGALADRVGRKPVMIGALVGSLVPLGLLSVSPSLGLGFTVLIALVGMFRFVVANLTQAGALDLAEGKRLEGSMVGLLWGNNALFGSLSPLIAGIIVDRVSGGNAFAVVFPYALALNLLALVAAFWLPSRRGPAQRSAAAS